VRVDDFEREVAVMTRLVEALEGARTSARDLYVKPVMTELHPLLALSFENVIGPRQANSISLSTECTSAD
jgi:hypothetical protein